MAYVYYPSCKFTEFSPKVSALLTDYMQHHCDAIIAGCCRSEHALLTSGDVAVTICNTCQAIVQEDSPARVVSIWELIAQDSSFTFPDKKGEGVTLQDCWRSRGCAAQQDAVRTILHRMNVNVVELNECRDNSMFCGTTLYAPQPEENVTFAPVRFGRDAAGLFVPRSTDEQRELMRKHCEMIETDKVVCYCVPCTKGIRLGGKDGVHLADYLFQDR